MPANKWRPLEAKKAPWEHRRPPKQVEAAPPVDEAKEQQDILELFRQGRKEMRFEVDKEAVLVQLPEVLQQISLTTAHDQPLPELRKALKFDSKKDKAPAIAKVNESVVMVGIQAYLEARGLISVLPVLDPTQVRTDVNISDCEFLREAPSHAVHSRKKVNCASPSSPRAAKQAARRSETPSGPF
ncbi:unnamed protein product [Symbiodinium necroappetens]|uniref:Uncharacterized protein n=1 Tax=Symbiodinium necroappetens TaxID=1628268 RepID=A0A812JPM2_9DINO|nr:unnamed protein product [Symbiodinium necroappetens]